jgi:hypothetical protein
MAVAVSLKTPKILTKALIWRAEDTHEAASRARVNALDEYLCIYQLLSCWWFMSAFEGSHLTHHTHLTQSGQYMGDRAAGGCRGSE